MAYIPAVISFFAVTMLSPVLISLLKYFRLTQPIRRELPSNIQKKKGTPLMYGGIFFVGIIIILLYHPGKFTVFLSIAFTLFSLIGFADDFWKATRQDPGGISGKAKLFFQFLFTGILLVYLVYIFKIPTSIAIYKSLTFVLPLGFYIAVISLFIVGSANAINFTDGLDGLLGVVAIPTYFFFYIISERQEVKIFCLVMTACILGFLIYNLFPAKAIMGDTGSLAIGGTLSILAIIEKVEILIPVLFFVYFAEQVSVILQVSFFKLRGRRLFRMSPVHYHFGLKYGWSENKIVVVFGVISWICAIISWVYREISIVH
jgi:phospho-N-acetylmuramoyl-pentapeptide-transferase